MIVKKICLTPYAIPFRKKFSSATAEIRTRRGLVVELTTDRGTGLGDMSPHPALADAEWAQFLEVARAAAHSLVGGGVDSPEHMDWSGVVIGAGSGAACGSPSAVAMGLDMALYDLSARTVGSRLAEFLSQEARPEIRCSGLVEGDTPLETAKALVANGYRIAKMKAHKDPFETQRALRALREAVPELRLRLDVNGAWDTAAAVEFCRGLPASALEWIEQPVAPGDFAGLRAVRETGVRVAADESVGSASDVADLVSEQTADVIVLKLMQVGGLAAALRAAREARRHGLEICLTTGLDCSIATAAVMHLSAALRPENASGFSTLSLLQGDLVAAKLTDGPWMEVPNGDGLGVTLDPTSGFLGTAEVYARA